MTNLVIADSEIELIPDSIASHPSVRASSRKRNKKPTECLLDSSLHYAAMRSLQDGGRRGRADIVHFCLLLALDSVPSKEGRLRTYVHTRGDTVMEFSPDVRLPKNYNRFQGLMESALTGGSVVSEGRELVRVSRESLKSLLRRLGGSNILLTEKGKQLTDSSLLGGANLVVGGFPHGDFQSDLNGIEFEEYSLYHARLMAWTAVSMVIARI